MPFWDFVVPTFFQVQVQFRLELLEALKVPNIWNFEKDFLPTREVAKQQERTK